ncbi:MAG: hypothetical protein ACR2FU_05720 [Streptosporangiaceae bacterium]
MTRTPRVGNKLRDLTGRIPAGLTRKSAAYAGAGLALAGVGTVASVTGLTGTPDAAAATAQPAALNRIVAPAGHTITPPATKPTARAKHTVPVTHAAATSATKPSAAKKAAKHATTWAAVSRVVAARTYPKATGHGALPAQDQLTPAGTSGPQTWLPMTTARYENAKAIVRAAIDRHMGVRSAVIAVATAMQESGLVNVDYGTSDSLGLFQQRPSCGWGTAAQIMHPGYAAGAFLSALHGYQQRTPGWASAPLWQAAQGVQASAYPYAYAKWEAQAATMVSSITKRLV